MITHDKFTRLVRVDKNGTKIYEDWRCARCGGAGGADKWLMTGFTCYACGGTGLRAKPVIFKEYTPEHEAKLKAQRAKRQAERQAKMEAEQRAKAHELNAKFFSKNGFDADGNIWWILGDTYSIKDDLKNLGCKFDYSLGWHSDHELDGYATIKLTASQICNQNEFGVFYSWQNQELSQLITEAQRAHEELTSPKVSEHVGKIGDKIEVKATLTRVVWYDTTFNYRTITHWIYIFTAETGNVFVWNTTSIIDANADDHVILRGTIKAHGEYNGIKQTELQRCKVTREEVH